MLRTINDVVEGAMEINELYVTNWLPSALPVGGKKSGSLTASQKWDELSRTMVGLSGTKSTHVNVYRCARSDVDWECTMATETKFVGANGITISPDHRLVLVNDPSLQEISVFERGGSGALLFVEKFHTMRAWTTSSGRRRLARF